MNRFVRARMRAAVLVHVVILLGGLVLLLLANSHTPAILSPVGYRADSSSHHEPNAQSQSLDGSVFERNASSDVSGASWQIEAMDKSARAVCVGSDVTRGEIEDLLCIPKPNYDDSFKNPCWWEMVTTATQNPNDTTAAPTRLLQCLPYFHILCCSKSGTTNLFHRLRLHPQILPNNGYLGGKELLFWAWAKNGYLGRWDKGTPAPFTKYIKRFNTVARFLETSAEEKKNFQYITYMWDLRGWPLLPQNRGLREPAVLTPHLMKHVYRNPKFIVLMREPVERLYTAYIFFHPDRNPHSFHRDVTTAIAMMDSCLATAASRRECYFNASVVDYLPVDLHYNCYVVSLKEWLVVFPRKHFLFMRTEDYSNNIKSSLLKVFDFLNI
ncbi:hypothetical protein BaRGS_00036502, partial [Batillaria attramentaria]